MYGFIQIFSDSIDGFGIIIIRLQIATNHFDDGGWGLSPCRIDELMRPDRLIAKCLLMGRDTLFNQALTALRTPQVAPYISGRFACKRLVQSAIVLDLCFDLPQI